MIAVHRPLSSWIAFVTSAGLGPINDGDDRADARSMPDFDAGWSRVAVPWEGNTNVLGLRLIDGEALAIELDNYGNPITVSPQAAAAIHQLEQVWPHGDIDLRSLAAESLPLRYWVLARLDAEGDPPDRAFSLLPWDWLDRATEAICLGLVPGGTIGELVETRHWLTPAVIGLTGPLEQLDHGLRTADDEITRLGATTLLANLRDQPLRRIPARSREKLSRLVELLADFDHDLSSTVRARLLSAEPDLLDPSWFAARLVVAKHLALEAQQPTITATLEFTDSVLGPQARGTLALSPDGLVITVIGSDPEAPALTVEAEKSGHPAVPLLLRGSALYAVLPWPGPQLPGRLIFRVVSPPDGGRA